MAKVTFKKGDAVKLRDDVLRRHARSVPAHMGYTREQFKWRDTLGKLEGKIGTIERIFPNSKHVNVDFGGNLIGIDATELVKVELKTEGIREIIKECICEIILENAAKGKKEKFALTRGGKFLKNVTAEYVSNQTIKIRSNALKSWDNIIAIGKKSDYANPEPGIADPEYMYLSIY